MILWYPGCNDDTDTYATTVVDRRTALLAKRHDRAMRETALGELRQVRGVPAATERLDQQDTGLHATPQDIDVVTLVRQCRGLRGYHVEIGILAADIAVGEDTQRVVRRVDRFALLHRLVAEDAQRSEIVLHLLKRREGRLPICRHRGIVSGTGDLRLRMTP